MTARKQKEVSADLKKRLARLEKFEAALTLFENATTEAENDANDNQRLATTITNGYVGSVVAFMSMSENKEVRSLARDLTKSHVKDQMVAEGLKQLRSIS